MLQGRRAEISRGKPGPDATGLDELVSSRAGVVAKPDAEVLDLKGLLLRDLQYHDTMMAARMEANTEYTPVKMGRLKAALGARPAWGESCKGELRTVLTATISPLAFLTLWSWRRKYQKRDLATTSLGAKILMRKSCRDRDRREYKEKDAQE
jgi:hypothetical protein